MEKSSNKSKTSISVTSTGRWSTGSTLAGWEVDSRASVFRRKFNPFERAFHAKKQNNLKIAIDTYEYELLWRPGAGYTDQELNRTECAPSKL